MVMINRIVQHLMRETPRGQPLDSVLLRELGVSVHLASHLVKEGWMYRLSSGAYLLTGDKPTRDGTIAFLGRRIKGLHVGGKTALAWYGVRHNIPFREKVVLWGKTKYKFPPWVEEVMLFSYQTTSIFNKDFPYGSWIKPMPYGNPNVLVSCPERALLELASEVGKGQSMEEVRNLAVMLRNLRPAVLVELMDYCSRVKVVKLVCKLGGEAGYSWGSEVLKYDFFRRKV